MTQFINAEPAEPDISTPVYPYLLPLRLVVSPVALAALCCYLLSFVHYNCKVRSSYGVPVHVASCSMGLFLTKVSDIPYLLSGFWIMQEFAGGAGNYTAICSSATYLCIDGVLLKWMEDHFKVDWAFREAGRLITTIIIQLVATHWARRKALSFLFACLGAALVFGTEVLQHLHYVFQESNSLRISILPSLICVAFQTGGWYAAVRIWRNFRVDAPPLLLAFWAAYIVVGAESFRFCSLLKAAHYENRILRLTINTVSRIVLETAKRLCLRRALADAICKGTLYRISPEADLLLRTRMGINYVPLLCIAYLLVFEFIGAEEFNWSRKHIWFALIIIADFIGGALADLWVIIFQQMLFEQRVLPCRLRALQASFLRLRSPGQHMAPRLWLRTISVPIPSEIPQSVDTYADARCLSAGPLMGSFLAISTLHLTLRSVFTFYMTDLE